MQKKKARRKAKRRFLCLIVVIGIAGGIIALVNRYYPLHHLDLVNKYADEYSVEPALVCAVIHAESKFMTDAVSNKGASGLMQVVENTAYWLAPKAGMEDFNYSQIFDPEINIRLGCYYLSMLEKQYGDRDVALCAYNVGSGNVDQWLKNPEYSNDGKTFVHVPFRETRDYVKRVTDNRRVYAVILMFVNLEPTISRFFS